MTDDQTALISWLRAEADRADSPWSIANPFRYRDPFAAWKYREIADRIERGEAA